MSQPRSFPVGSFDLIVSDPPWAWKSRTAAGYGKSPQKHYACLPLGYIMSLPVREVAAKDCLLLLWATQPMLHQALACVEEWGFTYKSFIIWQKIHPSGKQAIGLGFRVRSMVEPVIVATRGNPKHKPFPGIFQGVRRTHSRKPQEFYDLIDKCCIGLPNRLDMFTRESRPGWTAFGNESEKFDTQENATCKQP